MQVQITAGGKDRLRDNVSEAELLGFPNVRYDDQVDSVTQALAWIEKRQQSYAPTVYPVILRVHNPYRDAFPDYRDVPR